MPFLFMGIARKLLSNPLVWAVMLAAYGMWWADGRGYARHEREARAAIVEANKQIAALTEKQSTGIQTADSDRQKLGTEIAETSFPPQPAAAEPVTISVTAGIAKNVKQAKLAKPDAPATQIGCPALIPASALAKVNTIN